MQCRLLLGVAFKRPRVLCLGSGPGVFAERLLRPLLGLFYASVSEY